MILHLSLFAVDSRLMSQLVYVELFELFNDLYFMSASSESVDHSIWHFTLSWNISLNQHQGTTSQIDVVCQDEGVETGNCCVGNELTLVKISTGLSWNLWYLRWIEDALLMNSSEIYAMLSQYIYLVIIFIIICLRMVFHNNISSEKRWFNLF